jgi:hypothetical protein
VFQHLTIAASGLHASAEIKSMVFKYDSSLLAITFVNGLPLVLHNVVVFKDASLDEVNFHSLRLL